MTATTSTGSASSASCRAYAEYVVRDALKAESMSRADYYASEVAGFQLRQDLSPAFAAALAIDQTRALKLEELTSLMDRRRADGTEIAGRKRHSEHQSVASVFGLDELTAPDGAARLPTAEEIRNVLAGRRADGEAPRAASGNGQPLSASRVASAVKGYRRAIGVTGKRDATDDEIQRVADGKIDVADYRKRIGATTPAVGYTDITFSPDKSVSIAFGHAPTEAERAAIAGAVTKAVDRTMHAIEAHHLGYVRRGAGGAEQERAEMVWGTAVHTTARPVYEAVHQDAEGHDFTAPMTVPTAEADVQLHVHTLVFSAARSRRDGHIGSVAFGELHPKLAGAMFHAELATELRKLGARVHLGPDGEARLTDIPEAFRAYSSRRSNQGKQEAIKKWASEHASEGAEKSGADWISFLKLTGDRRSKRPSPNRGDRRPASDELTKPLQTSRSGRPMPRPMATSTVRCWGR